MSKRLPNRKKIHGYIANIYDAKAHDANKTGTLEIGVKSKILITWYMRGRKSAKEALIKHNEENPNAKFEPVDKFLDAWMEQESQDKKIWKFCEKDPKTFESHSQTKSQRDDDEER